jgi:ADP-ribose pyrophosphatase YjhB (NUDIX family)
MQLYDIHPKYFVAIDCVIFGYRENMLHLLIYPRGFEPSKGSWSLLGGFVQNGESSDAAAKRVLKQTTGLENIFMEQVQVFSNVDRDSEARVISIAYYALLRIVEQDEACVREHGAQWWPIEEIPNLVFDHNEMVSKSLVKLQQKAGFSLVGSELLSEKFTLMQLRKLYEAIFQRQFDPGNFRKKILSLGMLEKLEVKNSVESRKGAFYYRCVSAGHGKNFERIVKI